MTLLKGRKIAQQGHAGGENEVFDATAAITAPETTNQYSQLPPELKTWEIWLPFRTSPRPSVGLNKIPQNRQGRPAKYTDPSTWMSYEEAVAQSQRTGYSGVGIMLHKELGIMGIDFDHCIVDGVLDPEVEGWVAKLNTYTELSFSGEGLHSLAYGKLPWKANRSGKVEMYTDARFFVVTGRQMTGTPNEVMPAQDAIAAIHGQVFGNQPVETVDTTTPYYTEGREGELSAESLFPDDTVMAALRRNAVARKYFDGSAVTINASSADWDLARSLAFFCHGNLAQMRRLFMKSSLVREKTVSKRGAGDYWPHRNHADGPGGRRGRTRTGSSTVRACGAKAAKPDQHDEL